MKPVHSSLSVLFVAPFLSAAGHFHGISSSPKFFTLLLLIGAGNKSTRPKAGFVELKTARTDSARQAILRAMRRGYFLATATAECSYLGYFINRSYSPINCLSS